MYISVTPQNMRAGKSCGKLVQYLEKEDKYRENSEGFFNSSGDRISSTEVIGAIDDNAKKLRLKDKEARFYNVLVAPSSRELDTIKSDPNKLKDYARDVMKEYANAFNRENKDGSKVSVDDLVWFARLEEKRTFTEKDKVVRHNEAYMAVDKLYQSSLERERLGIVGPGGVRQSDLVKQRLMDMKGPYVITEKGRIEQTLRPFGKDRVIHRGMDRPEANQSHVHIIVSRAHKEERMSLSPCANSKGGVNKLNGKETSIGFDRMDFAKKCEVLYDLKFDHKREYQTSIDSKIGKANGRGLDYYTNMVVGKVVAEEQRQSSTKIPVGYNQFACFVRKSMQQDAKMGGLEGYKKHLDDFTKQYYPPNVLKTLNQKYEQIAQMKALDNLLTVNVPLRAVKEVTNVVSKAITSSYYISI